MIKDQAKKEEYIRKCTELYNSYLERGITKDPLPEIHSAGDILHSGETKKAGHKSAKSLAGKINRDRQEEKNAEKVSGISVSSISDLTRATIVIESFDEAVETIKNFAGKFKYLRGLISNKKETGSGYQGIHLKGLSEKGVPFEIQIHTPETLLIKKVSDCEYDHWRHFNKNYEVDQANGDPEKIKKINEKDLAKKKDDQACKDIYKFLYEITDNEFDKNISNVEATLEELNQRFKSQTDKPKPEDNKEIAKFENLSKYEIKGNPRELNVDKLTKVFSKSSLFKNLLPESQLNLVDVCEKVSEELYAPSVQKVPTDELIEEKNKLESENPQKIEVYKESKPKEKQNENLLEESKRNPNFGE